MRGTPYIQRSAEAEQTRRSGTRLVQAPPERVQFTSGQQIM